MEKDAKCELRSIPFVHQNNKQQVQFKKSSYCQPYRFINDNVKSGNRNVDGMILLAKNVGKDQYPINIYVHKVGSKKVKKIANTYISKNWTVKLVFSDNKIYYTGLKKDWRDEKQSWDIWCYDCKSNSNYCIIEEKQLKDTIINVGPVRWKPE